MGYWSVRNSHQIRIFLLTLFVVLLLAPPVSAQSGATSIESAALQVWPEYDDPGLLVIFSGKLAGEAASFPREIALPVPEGARNIQATYQDANGTLMTQQWQLKDGKVTYSLPGPDFHVEYYIDRSPAGNARDLNYLFVAPYSIATLDVRVQQPARATDFALVPAPTSATQGQDGLTYHAFQRQVLAAGAQLQLSIKYTKPDQGLTQPQLAVPETAVVPAAADPPLAAPPNRLLPWVLIGVGAAILVGALAYYLMSRRREVAPAPVRRAERTVTRPTAMRPAGLPPAATGRSAFCHACGQPLRPADRFCAQCGTPRRD